VTGLVVAGIAIEIGDFGWHGIKKALGTRH
jgi:hypothetical protein